MLSQDISWEDYLLSWADVRCRMVAVFWDSLYEIDNLAEFWFDDTIDHSLISYDEWFGRPGHY